MSLGELFCEGFAESVRMRGAGDAKVLRNAILGESAVGAGVGSAEAAGSLSFSPPIPKKGIRIDLRDAFGSGGGVDCTEAGNGGGIGT